MGKGAKNIQDVWVATKNQDRFYVPNKIISFGLAASLAGVTLSYKPLCHSFQETQNDLSYTILYWFLFIFYSFQGLDELIELFSVLTKREKGALGLLFEMNYFMGLALSIVITVFVFTHQPVAGFEGLYNWLYYQVVILFVAVGVIVLMSACFAVIQSRATRKRALSQTTSV